MNWLGEAIARFQGGSTYYHEELRIFRAYAEEAGLLLHSNTLIPCESITAAEAAWETGVTGRGDVQPT